MRFGSQAVWQGLLLCRREATEFIESG